MSEETKTPLAQIPRRTITYEMFEGWIVTAIEGGSGYWCFIPSDIFDKTLLESYPSELSFSEKLSKFIWIEKQTIPVFDVENNEPLGKINMKSVKNALMLICDNHVEVFERLFNEQYDAEDADVFFQYATLGELTFG